MTTDHVIFVSGAMSEKGNMKAQQIQAYGIDLMIDDDIANSEAIYRRLPARKLILFGAKVCSSQIPVRCASNWGVVLQTIETLSLMDTHWK